jgi:hypothetical protein
VSAGVWRLECDVLESRNMCGTCATDMAPVLHMWYLCYGYGGVLLARRLRCVVEEVEAGGLDRAVRVVACPGVSGGERR